VIDSFTDTVKRIILEIPSGSVTTYGMIAACAGNPGAARQVARILHSSSRKDGLPWHRVVNRNGGISLKPLNGYEIQRQLLEKEGVTFDENDAIDFDAFLWFPADPT
jgi:methylated-DNA-protein-cysteine methyltransferase related protein